MKKLLLSIILAVTAAFCFTGCYDAIYQSIRNEVELEEGTVSGFVNNVARFNAGSNQYLFTTNGNIYYKDASISAHGAWNKLSGNGLPDSLSYSYWSSEFDGIYFYKVISDSNGYVYALGFQPEYYEKKSRNQPKTFVLYYAKPDEEVSAEGKKSLKFTWTKAADLSTKMTAYADELKKLADDNYSMDLSVHLFGTNSYTNAHRSAYLRIGGGSPYVSSEKNESWEVYKLDGGSIENLTAIKTCTYDSTAKTYTYSGSAVSNYELNRYTLSAVWFDGGDHFLNALNAETNEGTSAASAEPTYIYFSNDGSETGYSYNGTYLCSISAANFGTAGTTKVLKDQKNFDNLSAASETDEVSVESAFFAGLRSLIETTAEDGTKSYSAKVVCPSYSNVSCRCYLGTTAPIISMAVTNDSIILGTGYNRTQGSSSGTGYGVYRVTQESGVPATSTSSFSTNASNVMCNPYYVRLLLCTDPSKNETAADIYSSMDYIYTESNSGTSISNRGLWAYFPGRGNWNRE